MLIHIGDALTLLAVGVLFPLMMIPLASLARSRQAGAWLWLAAIVFVVGASTIFASLAVDLEPPDWTPALGGALVGGLALGAVLVFTTGPAAIAARVSAPLDRIVRSVGRLSLFLIMAMAVVQFSIVILRYVFGLNFIAMQESVTYMHGAVFLLAGGYALLTDDHVRVDIFYREARPRTKAIVDLAGTYLLLFPFCLVAIWAAGPYVANSWAVREGSMEQSGIRGVFLLKSLILIYLTLLIFAGFVVATRAAETLKSRSD